MSARAQDDQQDIGFGILGLHFGGHSSCTGVGAHAGVHITTAAGCKSAAYSGPSLNTACYNGADGVHSVVNAYKTVSQYGCGVTKKSVVCAQPAPPCEPLIRPAAPAEDPLPIPECKPVFRKPCKPRAPCIPPLSKCPGFERILEKFALHVILLAEHTLAGQLQLKESVIGGFEESIEQLDNKLGPEFSIQFKPIVVALINLIEARLGSAPDEDRILLKENAESVLQGAAHNLSNYFGSMPQLCGKGDVICCILEGWVDVIKSLVVVIERLEEENGDPDAFREACDNALEQAAKVGKYFDSLCLEPKAPCAVELPSFSTNTGSNSLRRHTSSPPAVTASEAPATMSAAANGDNGGFGGVAAQDDGEGLFLQPSEPGSTLEPVIGSEMLALIGEERKKADAVVQLQPLAKGAANLRLTTGWQTPRSGKFSKQKPIPKSEVDKVSVSSPKIAGTAIAKVSTPLSDRSGKKLEEFQALELRNENLQLGRFGVYGDRTLEKGDNLTFTTEAGARDYFAFPISGEALLTINFLVTLLRESKNGSVKGAKSAGSRNNPSAFEEEQYAFKGNVTLSASQNEGVYTFPQKVFASGRRAHARITISDTPAGRSFPGYPDQRLFGISSIEVFINDKDTGSPVSATTTSSGKPAPPAGAAGRGRGRLVRGSAGKGRGSAVGGGNASSDLAALRRLALQQQRATAAASGNR